MKNVIKKITTAVMSLTLLCSSTTFVANAGYGDSEHFFKTWRWSELHGNYVYCYECLYCTDCYYQTQPRLVTVHHK